ncbi:MAG: aldo/keto reductase [Chloroflexi bacterium]|nr:aldo/keto reductase [Chloroflexota bacterium]
MAATQSHKNIRIGISGLTIKPLGIGTMAWGDRLMWDYGKGGFSDEDLKQAFEASLEAGVTFFDTAEIYGSGRSETLLGRFIKSSQEKVIVTTKFMPFPWRLRGKSLLSALRRSLDRLEMEKVDLYLIHWPIPTVSIGRWMQAMAQAVDEGLIDNVGVSNYGIEQTRRAHSALAKFGIPLAANQLRYSLFSRQVERKGLLKVCEELDVTVVAYSPLEQGLLTGKYSVENPPPGIRSLRTSRKKLRELTSFVNLLRNIGEKHDGKTPAQVAINWTICKGTLPIPGAKNLRQARENLGALGWSLTDEQVDLLDSKT